MIISTNSFNSLKFENQFNIDNINSIDITNNINITDTNINIEKTYISSNRESIKDGLKVLHNVKENPKSYILKDFKSLNLGNLIKENINLIKINRNTNNNSNKISAILTEMNNSNHIHNINNINNINNLSSVNCNIKTKNCPSMNIFLRNGLSNSNKKKHKKFNNENKQINITNLTNGNILDILNESTNNTEDVIRKLNFDNINMNDRELFVSSRLKVASDWEKIFF